MRCVDGAFLQWSVAPQQGTAIQGKNMNDRLGQLVKQITDGKGSFRAVGSSLADIESFQRTVRDLRELEANGYIEIIDEHPENHTGAQLIDIVLVRKR